MEREARKVQEQEHTGNRIKTYALKDDEKPEDNREKQHGIDSKSQLKFVSRNVHTYMHVMYIIHGDLENLHNSTRS